MAQCRNRNGVLEVVIPKGEQAKPRKIEVKAIGEKKANTNMK